MQRFVIEISRDGMTWIPASDMFTWIPSHFGSDHQKAQQALDFAMGKKLVLANGSLQSRIRDENESPEQEVPLPKAKPRKRGKKKTQEVGF